MLVHRNRRWRRRGRAVLTSVLMWLTGLAIGFASKSQLALWSGGSAREAPVLKSPGRARPLPLPAAAPTQGIAIPASVAAPRNDGTAFSSSGPAENVLPASLPLPPLAPPVRTENADATPVESDPDSSSGPQFSVHLGSYRSQQLAEREVSKLQGYGYSARVVPVDLAEKGHWYRVLVGTFPTRDAAVAARHAILSLPEYDYASVIQVPDGCVAVTIPVAIAPVPRVSQASAGPDSMAWPRTRENTPPLESQAREIAGNGATMTAASANAEQYFDFGLAQERAGNTGEAIAAFSKAIQIRPDHNTARNHLVTLYIQTNRLSQAREEILSLRDAIPNDPRLLFNEAFLAYKRQDWLNAQLALVRLFDVEPAHLPGHLLAGNVFEATGDLERALVEFAHAQRLSPEEPEVLYRYARLLDMNGRSQEALSAYQQFLDRALNGDRWSQVLDAVRRRVDLLRKT